MLQKPDGEVRWLFGPASTQATAPALMLLHDGRVVPPPVDMERADKVVQHAASQTDKDAEEANEEGRAPVPTLVLRPKPLLGLPLPAVAGRLGLPLDGERLNWGGVELREDGGYCAFAGARRGPALLRPLLTPPVAHAAARRPRPCPRPPPLRSRRRRRAALAADGVHGQAPAERGGR